VFLKSEATNATLRTIDIGACIKIGSVKGNAVLHRQLEVLIQAPLPSESPSTPIRLTKMTISSPLMHLVELDVSRNRLSEIPASAETLMMYVVLATAIHLFLLLGTRRRKGGV
jgi:hypothetical protein